MLIRIGTIVRPHGVKGEVKARPDTDDPGVFLELEHVHVGAAATSATQSSVRDARLQPSRRGVTVLLLLDGSDSREDADLLRGLGIYADEEHLPPLEPDEWFLDELVGMKIVDNAGKSLGVVEEILEHPAHPTMSVRRQVGRPVLIPAISPFITAVNADAREITVDLPDGLVED